MMPLFLHPSTSEGPCHSSDPTATIRENRLLVWVRKPLEIILVICLFAVVFLAILGNILSWAIDFVPIPEIAAFQDELLVALFGSMVGFFGSLLFLAVIDRVQQFRCERFNRPGGGTASELSN